MTLFEDIRILCELPGVSGREEPVREYIISQLPEGVSYETDALGNLYGEKKGANRPKNKVVLFAHMDEVGLMTVTSSSTRSGASTPRSSSDARSASSAALSASSR